MNTKEITIEKGWYYSAGRQYGWMNEHAPEGVGLNRDLFDADVIVVKVKSKGGHVTTYELDAKKALDFVRAHRSYKTIGTVKVGFVPRTLMREV